MLNNEYYESFLQCDREFEEDAANPRAIQKIGILARWPEKAAYPRAWMKIATLQSSRSDFPKAAMLELIAMYKQKRRGMVRIIPLIPDFQQCYVGTTSAPSLMRRKDPNDKKSQLLQWDFLERPGYFLKANILVTELGQTQAN